MKFDSDRKREGIEATETKTSDTATSQGMSAAPETGRGKEGILPLKPMERVQLCQHTDFSPANTGLTFADCKAMRE